MRTKPTIIEISTIFSIILLVILFYPVIAGKNASATSLNKTSRSTDLCAGNLKKLWQATAIYQSDYGDTGALLGYPSLKLSNEMQSSLGTNPCPDGASSNFISSSTPYLYLPRGKVSMYGKPLVGSFSEIRGAEGDLAVVWADINHNQGVPPLIINYPFKVIEINRGGQLSTISRKGSWQIFSGSFWQRGGK